MIVKPYVEIARCWRIMWISFLLPALLKCTPQVIFSGMHGESESESNKILSEKKNNKNIELKKKTIIKYKK
jgi:hypothetical protein